MKTYILSGLALLIVIAGTFFLTSSKDESRHTEQPPMNPAETATNIQETKKKFRDSVQKCRKEKKAIVVEASALISTGRRETEEGQKKLQELDKVLRQGEQQCREEQGRLMELTKSAYKKRRQELERKCRAEEEAVAAKYRAEISRVRGLPDEDRVHNTFQKEKNESISRCVNEQKQLSDEALRVHFEISSEE